MAENNVIKAFVVPHPPLILHEVGKGREAGIQKTIDAYKIVATQIAEAKPETLILISPHAMMYTDYFHISPGKKASGDFARFGAPQVQFNVGYDAELTEMINKITDESMFPAGIDGDRMPELDYGTMVPLYFINQKYTDYKIVRIGLSGLSLEEHYKFGIIIKQVVEKLNRRVVIVASGDLSHCLNDDGSYGYNGEGPKYDKMVMEVLENC